MKLTGRTIFTGQASGTALVSRMGISFYGGVDPETGIITEAGHDLQGQSVADRVLVFPTGKGSTVGSYILYQLKHNSVAPTAIINANCETITAVGCIISEIPCIDQVDLNLLHSDMLLIVNADLGQVEIRNKVL